MYNLPLELLQKIRKIRLIRFIKQEQNGSKEENNFDGVIFNITVQTLFLVLQPILC